MAAPEPHASPLEAPHAERLHPLVRDHAPLMRWLRAARDCGLADWCLGAGVVRTLVWNHLHDLPPDSHAPADVDFVYFDAADLTAEREAAIAHRLRGAGQDAPWEVVNQARVHLWRRDGGMAPPPLASLAAGIATWPETATCIGVSLDADDRLRILAPHGLDDLFGLVLRPSAGLRDPALYAQRLLAKRYTDKWPRLRVLPSPLS
ncbi:nucleotidyltransferase family protein [Achromobacter ruhlandii]|uniref:nucleotidyltransferase family protein n=1 Tax=Achromobacter ruhlandii TaxID=72557 RepID=UPI001E4546B5|nr:nucleotidyltransferase family protein [Achromobacter ruhlandii]